jgi:hypothetical protein
MPKAKATEPIEEQDVVEEEDITIDMTQAKTFEPLPTDRPFLVAMSAWKTGKSAKGTAKLHYELTVSEPKEFANRKVIVDQSLEEAFNLGRLQTMLIDGFGYPETSVKSKTFRLPKSDDMLGQMTTIWCRTQTDPSGAYADKSVVRRFALASVYKAPAAPGAI